MLEPAWFWLACGSLVQVSWERPPKLAAPPGGQLGAPRAVAVAQGGELRVVVGNQGVGFGQRLVTVAGLQRSAEGVRCWFAVWLDGPVGLHVVGDANAKVEDAAIVAAQSSRKGHVKLRSRAELTW